MFLASSPCVQPRSGRNCDLAQPEDPWGFQSRDTTPDCSASSVCTRRVTNRNLQANLMIKPWRSSSRVTRWVVVLRRCSPAECSVRRNLRKWGPPVGGIPPVIPDSIQRNLIFIRSLGSMITALFSSSALNDPVVSEYWILLKSQQDGEFADSGFGRVMTRYRRVTLTPSARLWIGFDSC